MARDGKYHDVAYALARAMSGQNIVGKSRTFLFEVYAFINKGDTSQMRQNAARGWDYIAKNHLLQKYLPGARKDQAAQEAEEEVTRKNKPKRAAKKGKSAEKLVDDIMADISKEGKDKKEVGWAEKTNEELIDLYRTKYASYSKKNFPIDHANFYNELQKRGLYKQLNSKPKLQSNDPLDKEMVSLDKIMVEVKENCEDVVKRYEALVEDYHKKAKEAEQKYVEAQGKLEKIKKLAASTEQLEEALKDF